MPSKFKFGPINYTSRDYSSIREDLLGYAKRYYSNSFSDFSDASFGSLMIDSISYIGDILSFYLDYQVNEMFLDTTTEIDNVMRIARQMGYKHRFSPVATGIASFFVILPSDTNQSGITANQNYVPTLKAGATLLSKSGNTYTLLEDIDFNNTSEDGKYIGVIGSDNRDRIIHKAEGAIVSGLEETRFFTIGEFQKFLRLDIPRSNIFEILSVTDSEGNEYYEVDHLSQNLIYTSIPNTGEDKELVPKILVPKLVARRFMVEQTEGMTSLIFGHGSESLLTENLVDDPKRVSLDFYGRKYISDKSFDPSILVQNDKFGIAPSDTTMTVRYSYNTSNSVNVDVDSITRIIDYDLEFPSGATDDDEKETVASSLEATNYNPIVGDINAPTIDEIKMRIFSTFASQYRAVTKEDYKALAYQMPSSFGAVRKCNVVQDADSNKRSVNLYILSEDNSGNLTTSNNALKTNLRTWINQYKMINDSIEILDGKIVNLGIDFSVLALNNYNKRDILIECSNKLISEITKRKLELGEPFYLTDVYKALRKVEGVLDVTSVSVYQVKYSSSDLTVSYSNTTFNLKEQMSPDGRVLLAPLNVAFEFKSPVKNIIGTVV